MNISDIKKLVNDFRFRTGFWCIPLQWRIRATISRISGKRSVLFLYNSYYHFFYLAKALRKQGWNAVTVNYEDPVGGTHVNFYHGEDINIYHPVPDRFKDNIKTLHQWALRNFDLLHFAGDGLMSFYPENWYADTPEDIVEWKRAGKKLGYTISGCLSCVSQTSFAEWSSLDADQPACNSCRWQDEPSVCSDKKNLAWGRKVDTYCDLICAEAVPALDYLASQKTVFNPLTMCLDPNIWHPDIEIPPDFRIVRNESEYIVYHSVGNYELRLRKDGKNIKGTSAVMAAIDRLNSEGIKVRLIFATDIPNLDVRYLQAQADVIVDQLIIGEYGANAREGMMLGKPVICYLNSKGNEDGRYDMSWKDEVPLVQATQSTIYEVLKSLLLHADKRREIGLASRRYALKWHSADACAKRYVEVATKLV